MLHYTLCCDKYNDELPYLRRYYAKPFHHIVAPPSPRTTGTVQPAQQLRHSLTINPETEKVESF